MSPNEPDYEIDVTAQAVYIAERSEPDQERYFFAYTITIRNTGNIAAKLLTRHWVITDGYGEVEHVRGPGVVGYQPSLQPGQSFTYTSGAILKTPTGMMQGEYLMVRLDGTRFETGIPAFALVAPEAVQ